MLQMLGTQVLSLVRELDPPCCNRKLGQPNKFKKINVSNFLCSHGLPRHSQTSPVQSPPTQVMCSTGIPKAGMLPGTCSWDHALSFPSKRGQPPSRGDERGPQDQEWGNTGPRAVISADFQEEGEPKSQSANKKWVR